MPVLHRLLDERLGDGALRGRRLAVVVHLEAKTACLVLALREAGADVVAAGSKPPSTQDSGCAALGERGGDVYARPGGSASGVPGDPPPPPPASPALRVDDGLR